MAVVVVVVGVTVATVVIIVVIGPDGASIRLLGFRCLWLSVKLCSLGWDGRGGSGCCRWCYCCCYHCCNWS